MSKEFKTQESREKIVYYEEIPEQVIIMLPDEQQVQYYIWDEMIKRMSKLYPRILLPVIKESFGKEYPKNATIEFLSTEYIVDRNKGNGVAVLKSIYADLVLRIAGKDVYHLECQIVPKRDMMVRMYEYDTQIALVHGVGIHQENQKTFVEMPNSIILYLTHTKNTPDKEKMQIRLPNGNVWEYQVPTLKVQNYSLEMIQKKKLYFLIPLTTIRYYSTKTKKKVENGELIFEQFLSENIRIIREAVGNGDLSEKAGKDILDFLNRGCQYLFAKDIETLEVVKRIMEPIFKLGREIFEEEATARITLEVTEKVTQQVTQEVTEQVTQQVTEQVTQQVTERDIREFISIEQEEGTEKAIIKRKIVRIFSVSEEIAEEKLKLYYK